MWYVRGAPRILTDINDLQHRRRWWCDAGAQPDSIPDATAPQMASAVAVRAAPYRIEASSQPPLIGCTHLDGVTRTDISQFVSPCQVLASLRPRWQGWTSRTGRAASWLPLVAPMNPGQCPSGLGATNIVNSCLGMAGASVSRVAAALHCGRLLVGRRAAPLAGGALRRGTLPGRQLGDILAAAHKWLPTAVTSCSSQGAGLTALFPMG